MKAVIVTLKIFTDTYTIEYQYPTSGVFSIYSKNGTFFMDYSGNNTILPLPSCEDVELFNLFQQMELFIPGDANCGNRNAIPARMANDTMLLTPAIVTA
ncbi:hypothetical protein HF324_22310 [Chitinophaga oryzae]|uniref:Uncharacterized protein n=1 Tax=Chitinophaga oryzae TaxID=2725414 RepID=A0AAE6ZJR5_9BACT|nr:hypothetical protein [Chitinophaga oryzae]QJB33897.1 hypothetical protein HF329_22415 [Chitinophaga oryzae]QJB40427.1 hypothetical protein HF324_22310 [Chitinophaga oryzae]